jgi:hypothetical protein
MVMASFEGRYGQQASLGWVREHEQELPPRPSLTRVLGGIAAGVFKPRSQ